MEPPNTRTTRNQPECHHRASNIEHRTSNVQRPRPVGEGADWSARGGRANQGQFKPTPDPSQEGNGMFRTITTNNQPPPPTFNALDSTRQLIRFINAAKIVKNFTNFSCRCFA